MTKKPSPSVIPSETIEQRILFIRGYKVILDRDLATLYGVETRALNQAVRRNLDRFPDDFMFELNRGEIMRLSQTVITSELKYSPKVMAFTEQGVAMLSSVLRSKTAIQVNIAIMRTFVYLKNAFSGYHEFAKKLSLLETKIGKHDSEIKAIFEAIRHLTDPHFEGFGYEENLNK